MATKEKTLIGYAFIVNAIHVILCFVIFFLRKFSAVNFIAAQGVLFAAEILIWFICGAAFALGLSVRKMRQGLLYGMTALLPIMIITTACALLGLLGDASVSGWAKYFFLGSAVNFWHRPAVILSLFINDSAYLIFLVNLAILFCASLAGANYGILLNISKQRKSKKRIKKVTLTKDKSVKPMASENNLPAESIETESETTEHREIENEQTSEDNGLKESKV